MEVGPTSPSYLTARLPTMFSSSSSRTTGDVVIDTHGLSGTRAPMMTSILPSSSSEDYARDIVLGRENNGSSNAVHVTPEMIKQPILLTFSAAGTGPGELQQQHNGDGPHHLHAIPTNGSTSSPTTYGAGSFPTGKKEKYN